MITLALKWIKYSLFLIIKSLIYALVYSTLKWQSKNSKNPPLLRRGRRWGRHILLVYPSTPIGSDGQKRWLPERMQRSAVPVDTHISGIMGGHHGCVESREPPIHTPGTELRGSGPQGHHSHGSQGLFFRQLPLSQTLRMPNRRRNREVEEKLINKSLNLWWRKEYK